MNRRILILATITVTLLVALVVESSSSTEPTCATGCKSIIDNPSIRILPDPDSNRAG